MASAKAPPGVTHVLEWLPPGIVEPKCGGWELKTAADFEAEDEHVPGHAAFIYPAAWDATPGDLRKWASNLLEGQVTLALGGEAWVSRAQLAPASAVPFYWVTSSGYALLARAGERPQLVRA